jgi:CheY-like chemotaxis protein
MPEMNGRELAFRIRQHHPRQPILLLTGDTDAEDESEHVDAVVKKPFQLEALERLIQQVLGAVEA